jgi:hypothetical protein
VEDRQSTFLTKQNWGKEQKTLLAYVINLSGGGAELEI